MKTRFNTYDLICSLSEMQKYVGMRVNNIYDIDNKTYLIRLQRSEEKIVLLIESGTRIHTTNFEWPKNVAPSGFSMKMRKHLRNKRLESLRQLGTDRIVDMQFGSDEAAYHVILELYDRGNVILTDYTMNILYLLRPHTEGDKFKFAVRETYPIDRARQNTEINLEYLKELVANAKKGDQLKKVLLPHYEYGPSLIEHVLLKCGYKNSTKIGKDFDVNHVEKLYDALNEAHMLFDTPTGVGYIIQKCEERTNVQDLNLKETFLSNQEFHPFLYQQHENLPHIKHETFNQAVDEFYSNLESQKIDLKTFQQEKEATKKLENVRKDHDQRLKSLEELQEVDRQRAELITRNQELVDGAILAVQNALASQISWNDIKVLVEEAQSRGDQIADCIKQLKLEKNHINLILSDPYCDGDIPDMEVDIDLGLTAFSNARRFYDQKRNAAKKQQKTIESQSKALKSAEKKTKQTLKEMQTIKTIQKARKVYWFEKFFWFISSENYLIIAGRDQQQNELIVKRYMRPQDIYVHADVHGASSVLIKNPNVSGQPVPPKTLNEAGTMAICYSVAWDAKVITNAYWVYGEQVSKTAPTGEYLSTGSFMVRGKKNYLPASQLILGLSFLFRLEETSIHRHLEERKIIAGDESSKLTDDCGSMTTIDEEIPVLDESDENNEAEANENVEEETKENLQRDDKASEDEDTSPKFPNTEIKIHHVDGNKINILTTTNTQRQMPQFETIVTKNRQNKQKKPNRDQQIEDEVSNVNLDEDNQTTASVKRGQKSKLKKIKEKYKDQDDEERKLRMDILQSAGQSKKNKKTKDSVTSNKGRTKQQDKRIPATREQHKNDEDNEEDNDGPQIDVDMLNSLTGIPHVDDELLFAVPVIAPYNTLANYKFKVKLTPGSNKRGKAAKTALNIFLQDRNTTQREKDLLKAVKDEQLARNIPGKVKLSAPRLQTYKK